MTWNLPALRSGRPATPELSERRAMADGAGGHPDQGTWVETRAGAVRCLTVTPPSWSSEMLYLHGGGYRMGTPEAWMSVAAAMADRIGCRVTVPDYRLAPEHPFPAALHDATTVLDHVRGSADDRPVVVGGDSAGGGLACAMAVACATSKLPPPDALVLLSPWLDLTLSGETFASRSGLDRYFPAATATEAADSYLQGHDPQDPLASPLWADVAEFPPTLILAASDETLLDDALRFARKLSLARRDVTLTVVARMQHAWPVISPDRPESSAALDEISHFLERVLGRTVIDLDDD